MIKFDDLSQKLKVALAQTEPKERAVNSDFDLNPNLVALAKGVKTVPAAVLVLITEEDDPYIVLTQRSKNLKKHAGQISFPGGRCDGAETAVESALREANEEVGFTPTTTQYLGFLDPYVTATYYRVVPVVMSFEVGHYFELTPNEAEVEAIFKAPLSHFLDEENYQIGSRVFDGITRYFYTIPWQHHFIWGATAGMLKNLAERYKRVE